MKKIYKIGFLIFALIISQQIFPQKENTKGPLTGEQQIELSEGYSFISSRIIAPDPDMLVVLESILNDNLDFIRNSQGQTLRKIGPNWVNGIGDWIINEGYLVKMFSDDSFIIEGDVVDPMTPIPLTTGFQFVSYFLNGSIDAMYIFETIIGDNLDFIRNSQGGMLRKIGSTWINQIGDCWPGEGYLVKMLSDDVLIYPNTNGVPCPEIPTVTYEGQVYNTVLIGNQCWLKENLNVGSMINGTEDMTDNGVIEKYCYDNDNANCDEYGGLYQWDEMMEYSTIAGVQGICPSGWHIPTDIEWTALPGSLGGGNINGKLKEIGTVHWQTPNWGATNASGFTALPGGNRYLGAFFCDLTLQALFWSSNDRYSNNAWFRSLLYYGTTYYRSTLHKGYGLSIRCLKD